MSEATRRETIAGALSMGWALAAAGPAKAEPGGGPILAYVGCRTNPAKGSRGEGIGVYDVPRDGSAWRRIQLVRDLVNPAYLAFDHSRRFLYAVHGDETEVSAFAIDPGTGQLSFLNRVPSGGRNPVHLTPDPTNRFMIVANHLNDGPLRSGIASLPIDTGGRLSAAIDVIAFDGKPGPHRTEQLFPRPHQVEFDLSGRCILIPDKGCDRVRICTLDSQGKLAEVGNATARDGSGPRHVALHPSNRYAYVINEIDSTVTAYRFDAASRTLTPFQILSSLPDTATGNYFASEIGVSRDGRYVYASNRSATAPFDSGEDTIATFAADPASGRLAMRGWSSTSGRIPRFFTLSSDGKSMFVGNEFTHTIMRLAIGRNGLPTGGMVVAHTGSPTCILFNA